MAAFAIRNFSVLSYAQGFTQWHYRAGAQGGVVADTLAPGFFSSCADMVEVGDHIHVSDGAGEGAILAVRSKAQRESDGAPESVVVEMMCGTAGVRP